MIDELRGVDTKPFSIFKDSIGNDDKDIMNNAQMNHDYYLLGYAYQRRFISVSPNIKFKVINLLLLFFNCFFFSTKRHFGQETTTVPKFTVGVCCRCRQQKHLHCNQYILLFTVV